MPEQNDNTLTETRHSKHNLNLLSPREFNVFRLLSKGLTAHDVADELSLSYKTICNYNTQIKSKLNANTSADLANIAMVHKII